VWKVLQVIGIAVAVAVLPLAYVDPVLGGLAGWVAVVTAGLISLHNMRYASVSLLIACASVLMLCHRRASGFAAPTLRSLVECTISMVPPLAIALLFVAIALFRRRGNHP
jgi:hypothetical protein